MKMPPTLFFFFFLGPNPKHMEVPNLGVEPELQPPAYTTATETQIQAVSVTYTAVHCNANILNPLGKARDWTHTLKDTSCVHNLLSHNENSENAQFLNVDNTFKHSVV